MAKKSIIDRIFNRSKTVDAEKTIVSDPVDDIDDEFDVEFRDKVDELSNPDSQAQVISEPIQPNTDVTALVALDANESDKRTHQLVEMITKYLNEKFSYILQNHILDDGRNNAEIAADLLFGLDNQKENLISLFRLNPDALRDLLAESVLFVGSEYYSACKKTPVTESNKRSQLVSDAKEIGTLFADGVKNMTKEMYFSENNLTRRRISSILSMNSDKSRASEAILEPIYHDIHVLEFLNEYLTICKNHAEHGESVFLDLQNSDIADYIRFIKTHRESFSDKELATSIVKMYDYQKEMFFEKVYQLLSDLQNFDEKTETENLAKANKEVEYYSSKCDALHEKVSHPMFTLSENVISLLNKIYSTKQPIPDLPYPHEHGIDSSYRFEMSDELDANVIDAYLNALGEDDFAYKLAVLNQWYEYLKISSPYFEVEDKLRIASASRTLQETKMSLHTLFKAFESAENSRIKPSMFRPD